MARTGLGDERAFRMLVARHAGRALALARRRLRNDAAAEEVVQDAMLRVWVNAPRWRPEAAFRTWLYRVVVNLCLNARRRPTDLPLVQAGDPADPAPDAGAVLEARERDRKLSAAIVLTYQEGLGNAEAAAVLDISVSSLEALLVRAKRTLRATLEEFR